MQPIPPQPVTYRLPANDAQVADRWYADQGLLGQSHQLPAVQVHSFRNAWVNPYGVAFAQHKLLGPSIYPMHARDRHTKPFVKSYLKNRVLGRVGQGAARVALVQHPWLANYYHFTCEVLPRLFVMRDRLADCTLLLPESERRPFHDVYLGLFDIGDVRWVPGNKLYKATELLVPDFTNGYGLHNPAVFAPMRDFLVDKLLGTTNADINTKCIYISRAKAPKRKVLNEAAMWERLQPLGFEEVFAEDLTVPQQAQLFHSTRIAVGANGAAWSNLLFMRPGSHVLNLVHAQHPEFVFYTLSSLLDIAAYHIPCMGDGTGCYAGSQDMIVPLKDVDAILKPLMVH